jgi:hypothetical protein
MYCEYAGRMWTVFISLRTETANERAVLNAVVNLRVRCEVGNFFSGCSMELDGPHLHVNNESHEKSLPLYDADVDYIYDCFRFVQTPVNVDEFVLK